MVALSGLMDREVALGVTPMAEAADSPEELRKVTVAWPSLIPNTRPVEFTVTIFVSEEDQAPFGVVVWFVAAVKDVACSCSASSTLRVAVAGVTDREDRLFIPALGGAPQPIRTEVAKRQKKERRKEHLPLVSFKFLGSLDITQSLAVPFSLHHSTGLDKPEPNVDRANHKY
jgi:hypothetical protein